MSTIDELKKTKRIMEEAIQSYMEYEQDRIAFEDKDIGRGIFQPIRAIVKTYTTDKFDLRKIMEDTRHVQSIVDLDEMSDKSDESAVRWFMRESSVVGYLSTRVIKNDDKDTMYGIGCSFCRPQDFLMYQKFIGIKKACLVRFMTTPEDMKQIVNAHSHRLLRYRNLDMPALDAKADNLDIIEPLGREGICVYYMPFTLQEQLNNFIRRCGRYYKVND